jgi:hypothetical protein
MYLGSQDALVAAYPSLTDGNADGANNKYRRHELDLTM